MSNTRAMTASGMRCQKCGTPAPMFPSADSPGVCEDCGEPFTPRNARKTKPPFEWGILIPMAIVVLAVGLCFLYTGHQKVMALETRGVETNASPTLVREENRSGGVVRYIRYAFQVPGNGTLYSHRNLFDLNDCWTSLDDKMMQQLAATNTLRVRYDPENPWNNTPAGTTNNAAYAEAGICGALGVILISKSVLYRLRQQRQRRLGQY